MTIEQIVAMAAALGLGTMLPALAQRFTGRPAPSGAEGRLADAQADKARAEADALAWAAMRAELDRMGGQVGALIVQVATQADLLSIASVKVETLTAEVDRLRAVERGDKQRIAELEARVAELEARHQGAGDASAKDG